MRKTIRYGALALACAQPLAAGAFGDEDYMAWFKANQAAKPQFVDGDTITFEKAELVKPFIPAEYQSELIYQGMEMKIKDAGDITPADVYKAATEKFKGQAKIAADGALENYTAGRPFDPAEFTPGKESGSRMVWNWNFRWQNAGLRVGEVHWVWVRKGGDHNGHEVMSEGGGKYKSFYTGGGSFERVLTGPYQRVMFSHRSDLEATNYKVNNGEGFAKDTEFREYTGFTSPFDIAGTAFLILRYDDPRKTDDSWAYIPSLRRVRRISVEVKSDSLLGTDHTLEDFYCFNGRPLEHDWEYMGTTNILAVARSRNTHTIYGGPNGWVPVNDDWALRKTDVLKQIPKRSNHPYSFKYLHIDRDSGECYYANAFDRGGKLWKVWQLSKEFTDDPQFKGELQGGYDGVPTPEGLRVSCFQSINVIDLQNSRATLVPTRGIAAPRNQLEVVKRILDVNYLTEGRR
jgi:hypothetical protein